MHCNFSRQTVYLLLSHSVSILKLGIYALQPRVEIIYAGITLMRFNPKTRNLCIATVVGDPCLMKHSEVSILKLGIYALQLTEALQDCTYSY